MAVDYGALAGQFLSGSKGAPQNEYITAKESARAETERAEGRTMGALARAEDSSVRNVQMEATWNQHLMDFAQRNYQFEQQNQRDAERHAHDMELKQYGFDKLKENDDILTRMQEEQLRQLELGNAMSDLNIKETEHGIAMRGVYARELNRMLGQRVTAKPFSGLKGAAGPLGYGQLMDQIANLEVTGQVDAEYQAKKLGVTVEQLDYMRGLAEADPEAAMGLLQETQFSNEEAAANSYDYGMQLLQSHAGLMGQDRMTALGQEFTMRHADDPDKAGEMLVEDLRKVRSDANASGAFSKETASLYMSDAERSVLARPNFTEEDRKDQRALYEEAKKRHAAAKALAEYHYDSFDAAYQHLANDKNQHFIGAVHWDRTAELNQGDPAGHAKLFLDLPDAGVMQPVTYRTQGGQYMTMYVRSSARLSDADVGKVINAHREQVAEVGGATAHVGLQVFGKNEIVDAEGDGLETGVHFQVVDATLWGPGEGPAAPALRSLPNSTSSNVMPVGRTFEVATGGGKLDVTGVDIQYGVDALLDMVGPGYSYDDAFTDLIDGVIDDQVLEDGIVENASEGVEEVVQDTESRILHTATERMGLMPDGSGVLRPAVRALIALPHFMDLPLDPSNPVMAEREGLVDEVFQDYLEQYSLGEEGLFEAAVEMLGSEVPPDALLGMANDYAAGIMMAGAAGNFDGWEGGDSRPLIEDGYATLMRTRDNLAQDEATTKLLDNFRARIWQTVTLPALRKHQEAKEPRIGSYAMDTDEGRQAYAVDRSRWLEKMAELRAMGETLPGGGYTPPQPTGAEYLQVGEATQEAIGEVMKLAQGLSIGQGHAPSAGSILAANPEVEASKMGRWMTELRALAAGSSGTLPEGNETDSLMEAMTANLGGSETEEKVKAQLRKLASGNIPPEELEDMEVLVPYGTNYAAIPFRAVKHYWRAQDEDNGGRRIETVADRVSSAMVGVYPGNSRQVALSGKSAEDLVRMDDALVVAADVFGVGPEGVGAALRERMGGFIAVERGAPKASTRPKNAKGPDISFGYTFEWRPGMSGTSETGLMGLVELLPPERFATYDKLGDPGLVLALYKNGLGPVAKRAASDEFRGANRSLFQALEAAEAKARAFIEEKDPTGSRGERWRRHTMADYLDNAAMGSTQFQELDETQTKHVRKSFIGSGVRRSARSRWQSRHRDKYTARRVSEDKKIQTLDEILDALNERWLGERVDGSESIKGMAQSLSLEASMMKKVSGAEGK